MGFGYAEGGATCETPSIYKTGAKEIAGQEGMSITFMAKPNEREGNSCHIHLSLRTADGAPLLAGDGRHGMSKAGEHFLAGQLAALRELTLCYAPNINSYKRYQAGSFAPTAVRWGVDNRSCAMRLVGHGHGLRVENRAPGGDVNPYLAVAAMIAAGLHGIDHQLPLQPAFSGNAYGRPRGRGARRAGGGGGRAGRGGAAGMARGRPGRPGPAAPRLRRRGGRARRGARRAGDRELRAPRRPGPVGGRARRGRAAVLLR